MNGFEVGQKVFSVYSKHGGALVGTVLTVARVVPGGFVGRGSKRLKMDDRILCSDARWYYPEDLSTANPLE